MPKHIPKNVVGLPMPWQSGTLASVSLLVAVASGISSMLKTFVDIHFQGKKYIPVTETFQPKVSFLHNDSKLSFKPKTAVVVVSAKVMEKEMGESVIRKAEELMISAMKGNDASHDAAHAFRVRDLALSLAQEEGLSSSPEAMEIVELAALLHDIGDYKYVRDPSEERIVERFLEAESVEESKRRRILSIIKGMGFKEELACDAIANSSPEFKVVQDADRLDAIGAIGIARCFTFGGSRNQALHDPNIKPRLDLAKEQYMKKDEQTSINHFHEKLLKLKDLMKTEAGQRRAEKRHKVMEDFIKEFYEEWDGRS